MLSKTQELLILSQLRNDARQSLTYMSKKTRIPVSTLHEKLKGYKGGVIPRHTSLLHFPSLGYSSQVTMMLAVEKEDKEKLRSFLLQCPLINSCFHINNGFDFFAEAVFQSMHEAEIFLDSLDQKFQLKGKHVHYVIDELKREAFLSSPDYVHLLHGS